MFYLRCWNRSYFSLHINELETYGARDPGELVVEGRCRCGRPSIRQPVQCGRLQTKVLDRRPTRERTLTYSFFYITFITT